MSSDFLYIKRESKGQFEALQHILRKVSVIVSAFHLLSSNNLYGQSNELVESVSLMCLCIQQKVRALIKAYLPRPAHPLISPVNPLLPGSFLYFRIPSRLSFVWPQPCQKCIRAAAATLGGDGVVKVVAMETRHRRNVEKLFKEKPVLHFLLSSSSFPVSEIAFWEAAGSCPTEIGFLFSLKGSKTPCLWGFFCHLHLPFFSLSLLTLLPH